MGRGRDTAARAWTAGGATAHGHGYSHGHGPRSTVTVHGASRFQARSPRTPAPDRGTDAWDITIDMRRTCEYTGDMKKMIQIRNVPEDLHRKLKARAALEGLSLSDYLLAEVRRVADRPTVEEMRRRLGARDPVLVRPEPVEAVRRERDRR